MLRLALRPPAALRRLPLPLRDGLAVALILGLSSALGAWPSVQVSLAVPVLAAAVAGLALTLGRGSALLAAMLLLLVLRWLPGWEAALALHLLEVLALCVAGLGGAALIERLRRERDAARQAHLLMDTTVQSAAARVEQARRELERAEARLAAVQQRAAGGGTQPMSRDPFEQAIRSEGGV